MRPELGHSVVLAPDFESGVRDVKEQCRVPCDGYGGSSSIKFVEEGGRVHSKSIV